MTGFPERTTSLRDGTRVLLREARPEDAPLVRLGFDQLSDRSRQFRFLRTMPRLSDDDLSFLAGADGNGVIGALDRGTVPPQPAALARSVRIPGRDGAAAVAITVIDSHQGRGLGTLLFGCLAWQAQRAGLTCFLALVHVRNSAMRGLLDDLAAAVEEDQGGELQYRLPLLEDPAGYPPSPAGDAFRAAYRLAAGA